MKRLILALPLLLLIIPALTFADPVVEVIPVYNRPASEIQPLLMPLLESTDQIVANGDSLIVKTTPGRVHTIENIIRRLDNPVNNLLITVIQSRDVTAEQLNAGIGFDVNIPLQNGYDPYNAGAYPGQYQSRVYGQAAKINSTNNNKNTQTIRTLDGGTAHIKVGNAVPITNYQVYPNRYGGYPGVSQSTQYVEATTGFAVTPRLVGQQVVMDVSPWSDRLNSNGQIQSQSAQTTIRANLGEWVDLGGVDESGQSSSNGLFSYSRQSSLSNLHILVKVDVVN